MIGRLSAATEPDMNTLVNKTLNYLQSPPSGDWPKEHLLVASYYRGHDYTACKEDISNTYYPGSNPVFWKIYGDDTGDLSGSNSNVNSVINQWHVGTVNYRGHGGYSAWDQWCYVYPYSYTVSDAYALTNGNYTPIVLSIACSTGRFYEDGEDCLTEAFVKNGNGGAVGALGPVEPTYPNRNDCFDKQLYWDILKFQYNIGQAVWHSILMTQSEYPGGPDVEFYTWFGDPALKIWTSQIPGQTQIISLAEGWNLISFTVNKCFYEGEPPTVFIPEGVELVNIADLGYETMDDWVDSVIVPQNAWECIRSFDVNGAHTLVPDMPLFNDLKYFSVGYGYQVKIKEGTGGAQLKLEGARVNPTTPLQLQQNWNFIGYMPSYSFYYDTETVPTTCRTLPAEITDYIQVPAPVTDTVLASISGQFCVVRSYDCGQYYTEYPVGNVHTLHYMGASYGYWIKMYNAAELIFPTGASQALPKDNPKPEIVKANAPVMTPFFSFVYGAVKLDGEPAKQGDTIIVYNSDKTVVGKGLVKKNGMYGAMAIYGDDPYTIANDGARPGEVLSFEVNGLSATSINRVIWNEDGEVVKVDLIVSSRPPNPKVGQNFPNPFNPDTWIPYQLSESAHVVIKIYNIQGQLVRTLDLGSKDAGYYTTKERAGYWDGRNVQGECIANGVYFYTIKAGNFVATKKLAIMK